MNFNKGFENLVDEKKLTAAEKEFFDEKMIEVLMTLVEKINEGNEGLILYADMDEIKKMEKFFKLLQKKGIDPDIKEHVLKILKIYQPGAGKHEHTMQKAAFDIIEKQGDDFAKVPKPQFFHEMTLTTQGQQALKNLGLDHTQEKSEILLMDFVPGVDVRTMLYREVLRICGEDEKIDYEYRSDNVAKWPFDSLEQQVAQLLRFSPKSSDLNANDKVLKSNDNKLFSFLAKEISKGKFSINAKLIKKLQKTVRLLNENGLCLRDAHLRNFMIDEDGDEAYIIDFGKAIKKDRPIQPQDYIDELTNTKYANDQAAIDQLMALVSQIEQAEFDTQMKEITTDKEKSKAYTELIRQGRMYILKTPKGQLDFGKLWKLFDGSDLANPDEIDFELNVLARVLQELIGERIKLDRGMFAPKDVYDAVEKFISNLPKDKQSQELIDKLNNFKEKFSRKR